MQVYSIEGTSSSTVVVISNLGKVREIIAALDTIVVGSVAVNLLLLLLLFPSSQSSRGQVVYHYYRNSTVSCAAVCGGSSRWYLHGGTRSTCLKNNTRVIWGSFSFINLTNWRRGDPMDLLLPNFFFLATRRRKMHRLRADCHVRCCHSWCCCVVDVVVTFAWLFYYLSSLASLIQYLGLYCCVGCMYGHIWSITACICLCPRWWRRRRRRRRWRRQSVIGKHRKNGKQHAYQRLYGGWSVCLQPARNPPDWVRYHHIMVIVVELIVALEWRYI